MTLINIYRDAIYVNIAVFELRRELANAASIVQGIIEFFTGGAAVIGGSSLCVAGVGATLGASCWAAAPAIASGAALSAHGLSLIKNGIENDTDAKLKSLRVVLR